METIDKISSQVSTVPGHPRTVERIDGASADERLLASLGYKQEFKREFSKIELFGVAFSCVSIVPTISSVLVFAMPDGGTSSMVWGWAVCAVFTIIVSLSMAELGSAMPTSGGLYYWTFTCSSPRWRCLFSWIVGYANTIGLISGFASVDWGLAVQITAAASIGSDMRYVPATEHVFGVFVAILFSQAVICSLGSRVMARLQHVFLALNLSLCLAVIIALPAATPKEFKNDASYALGGFVNLNGWPDGYAFILSFLSPIWAFGVYDSSVHISEEAANSRTAVPFAIISSSAIAGTVGWAINVALAFNMGTDLEGILSNPIGQPLAVIFFNNFGKHGTLALWTFIITCQFAMGLNCLLISSRQTFAFARDGGLPLSRYIYRINEYTKTPVVGVWMAAIASVLLGLLAFAGPAAIEAIFTLGIAGLNIAYLIPLAARISSKDRFIPGPFSLGKFSIPIGIISVTWLSFIIILVMFPTTPKPEAISMNYTVVVLGGFLGLALVYYYFPIYGGVYWFKGPQKTFQSFDTNSGDELPEMDGSASVEKSVEIFKADD